MIENQRFDNLTQAPPIDECVRRGPREHSVENGIYTGFFTLYSGFAKMQVTITHNKKVKYTKIKIGKEETNPNKGKKLEDQNFFPLRSIAVFEHTSIQVKLEFFWDEDRFGVMVNGISFMDLPYQGASVDEHASAGQMQLRVEHGGTISFNNIEVVKDQVIELWSREFLPIRMQEKGVTEPIFALNMSTIRPSHELVLNECMEYAVRCLPESGLTRLTLSNFPQSFPL